MRSLLVVLFVLAFWFVGNAQIINFPDPNFKNALVNTKCVDADGDGIGDAHADLNGDSELQLAEALLIETLLINGKNISNLSGIENFFNLTNLNCSENKIQKLDLRSLTKLEKIFCGFNNIQELLIKDMANLKWLVCTSNQLITLELVNLPRLIFVNCAGNKIIDLLISNTSNLESLECDRNKMTVLDVSNAYNMYQLACENNLLETLILKNGTGNWPFLFFDNNENLKFVCCDEKSIDKITLLIRNLGLSECEVNSYCSFSQGGKIYIINGSNKWDGNGIGCDIVNDKLAKLKFEITTESIIAGKIISDKSGNYKIPVQAGTHTITPTLEYPNYFEVTPPSFTVTFPSTSDTITQNFCITPKGVFRQTNITVIPLTPPARPGFEAQYKIVWENVGNQIESGTLNFTYDETLLDYISATQTADQVADGIVKWNFINLLPFEKREIIVTLKVNRPTDTPAVNAGDKLYLNASILDNIFTLENTVVGSYDPNDKTCLQGDRIHPDQIGKFVDFLIRFENTGNYAAENVVVKDIIDTKTFDVSSLQITDASHEMFTRIEGNKVEFIFEKIQLPFDDANNDGYVAFKIKTLPTLIVGDSLKNLADIYFDYNFPIRTNETKSTLAFPVSTYDVESDVRVYPNPVTDILTLEIKDDVIHKVEIFDLQGRIIRSSSIINNQLNVSDLKQGSYISKAYGQTGIGLVRFVKL